MKMLKKRLIPILLLKDGRMVKTIKFDKMRDVGNPVSTAKIYDAQIADELVFLDINATLEGREAIKNTIDRVTKECFMPFAVGGGVKTLKDIQELLKVGADKVVINSAAVETPQLIKNAIEKFGTSNIVVSIDYKINEKGENEVYTHGGTKPSGKDPVEWAKEIASLGAGEIILTCIDKEGTMKGYDLDILKKVTDSVDIPVIAHGGVGTLTHLKEGLTLGGASGVAAASIFHFTDQSPIKARQFLVNEGINIKF